MIYEKAVKSLSNEAKEETMVKAGIQISTAARAAKRA